MNYDKEIAAKEQARSYQGPSAQGLQYQGATTAPPQPTRFSGFAAQLEARVTHLGGMVDRLCRVADRLSGGVPEEAPTSGKLRGSGSCVAGQIEQTLEDFDVIGRRAERVVERLELL